MWTLAILAVLCGPNKLRDAMCTICLFPALPCPFMTPQPSPSLAYRSHGVRQWTAPLPHIPGWTQRLSPVNTY